MSQRLAIRAGSILLIVAICGCSSRHSEVRTAAAAGPSALAGPSAAVSRLDRRRLDVFFRERAAQGFSGAVSVSLGDVVLLQQGYGLADDASSTPVTRDTVMDLGSLTKEFTAAAILLLEQQGRLSTTDRLDKYLAAVPPDKSAITIHQLLTHTAGFQSVHGRDLEPVGKDEALRRILAQKLAFPPGGGWSYSNSGYTLLAAIIERVSGQAYLDFMRSRILGPLRLTRTGVFGERKWQSAKIAHAYVNGKDGGAPTAWAGPYWTVMGNGEWLSTAPDMEKWLRALFGGRVVARKQVAKLIFPHADEGDGGHYGYAWHVDGSKLGVMIHHGGAGNGGNADVAYFPDLRLRIVILSNRIVFRRIEGTDRAEVILPAQSAREALVEAIASGRMGPAGR